MSFPNIINGTEQEVFNSYTTERIPVGSKMVLDDGRIFRFAEVATGAATVVGSLYQAAVPTAAYQDELVATLAAGVTVLTAAGATSTTATVDLLKYGYVYSSNATDLPLMRIKSNTLITAGSTGTITLFTKTPTAIAAATTISYFLNPWRDVLIHDSPATGVYTGVAKIVVALDAFGWLQTAGPCSVLYSTTTTAIAAVNDPVCGAPGVAGSVQGLAAGTTETNPIIGFQLGMVEADTEQNAIFLVIE